MERLDSNIVCVDWLSKHLDQNLVVLDATMKFRPDGEPIETPSLCIQGAREFNFDTQICQQETELPHMLPSADIFQKAARDCGINRDTMVVVYDAMGIFSSPRVWWMFKVFGHDNVVVLNGGLPKWIAEGFPCDEAYAKPINEGDFVATFNAEWLYTAEQIKQSLHNDGEQAIQIIDGRSTARFSGAEQEPRPGLKRGHIPGSKVLPFTDLMENGLFKSKQDFVEMFNALLPRNAERLVFTCGSGVTACVLALAADEIGYRNLSVYDGAWSEWGAQADLPVETGA